MKKAIVDLIKKTGDYSVNSECHMNTLDKGMIHILSRMQQKSVTFHHATKNGVQFKTYKSFISGTFHFRLQVTKTMESRNVCKGRIQNLKVK
jgi:hypothetical protein